MRRSLGLAVLITAVAALVVSALGAAGASTATVQAEFKSARGLVPGNDVRVSGAPAGSVSEMELTDRGTALVTLELHDGIAPPRADASAAIRPVDLIGDNYVALEPGHDEAELEGPIPTSRTLDVPRLDDLLRSFGDSQRASLKILLVEAGITLDDRGEELNRTALALRPALEAADGVMAELGSQSADLRSFVTDAERVTRQASSRDRDLGRSIGALDATLHATADNAEPLDAALARLPRTLDDLDSVATRLRRTATATTPLAASVNDAAPALSEAAVKARPFLRSLGTATAKLHPTLRLAGRTLERGGPTLDALESGLGDVISTNPKLRDFADVLVPAAPAISEGFFVNFPDQAAEPGKQPFDPFADPRRHYWRGAAVLTCQSFGMPIEPGCLESFLAKGRSRSGAPADDRLKALAGEDGDAGAGAGEGADQSGLAPPPASQTAPGAATSTGLGAASDVLDFVFGP